MSHGLFYVLRSYKGLRNHLLHNAANAAAGLERCGGDSVLPRAAEGCVISSRAGTTGQEGMGETSDGDSCSLETTQPSRTGAEQPGRGKITHWRYNSSRNDAADFC